MKHAEAAVEIDRLSNLIRTYEHEYHVLGKPSVSDIEYDGLFDALVKLEEAHPDLVLPDSPTARIGSDLSSDLPEVEHRVPVLSLDKAYSIEDLSGWIERTTRQAGASVSFVVEEKIDGISIVLYYEGGILVRGVTRGNGLVGNDVTSNIRTIRSVPLRLREPVDLAVRGEIFLPLERFAEYNSSLDEPYANPRNLVAGSVRRIKSADTAAIPLTMFAYEAFMDGIDTHVEALRRLDELGFRWNRRVGFFSDSGDEPDSIDGGLRGVIDEIPAYVVESTAQRRNLSYEIDGLVVKVNEIAMRTKLGQTGHHPRWAVAFKFESPEGVAVIEAIDIQVGRTGRITPVARVAPVAVGGTTISNVTLHNQEYVNMLELSIGDSVVVARRGDVIPAVERVVDKNQLGNTTWQISDRCPSCTQPLSIRGAHHFCTNLTCPAQVKGGLYFFVGRDQMDIDSVGPETIDVLLREGLVEDLPDLYRFDPEELSGVAGFGEKKIDLIRNGILASKSRPYRVVLPSLGIPELGPKVTELLIDAGIRSIDELLALVRDEHTERLTSIPGIGEKTAERIINGLSVDRNLTRIERLRELGLQFEEEMAAGETAAAEAFEQMFSGQIWCVTGSFDRFKPRSLATDEVVKRGGIVTSQISGKTTQLLAGSGAGSKLDKARRLEIEVVDEAKFLSMIEGER